MTWPASAEQYNSRLIRTPRLVYLQYVRAAAALAVMLYHVSFYTDTNAGFGEPLTLFTEKFGYYGVVAFFVLSGYLMSALIQETSVIRFLAHRFLRIYPAYWLCSGFLYAARFAAHHPQSFSLAPLLLPITLTHAPLGIEWTLVYEVAYYVITASFCLPVLRRLHAPFLVAWLGVCLAVYCISYRFASYYPPDFAHIATSMWNIPFLLGGLSYYALPLVRPGVRWGLTGAALLLMSDTYGIEGRVILAPAGMVLAVMYLVERNQQETDIAVNEPLLALGNYSYGLYLVHARVAIFVTAYLVRIHPGQGYLIWLTTFGLCLAAGCLAGAVDVWLYARLKRFADYRLRNTQPVNAPVVA